MKKLLWIFVPVLMLAACQKYDDTALKQEIRKLDERVTALETIKTDISGLQTAVQNLQKGFTVSSVKEVSGGWEIVFSDGNKITVKNGTDGASPVIAVRKDTDGKYYWTVNGEWLLDGGAKVPVTGADGAQGPEGPAGKTPQIDIQEGWWVVRFADNEEWKKIAEATSGSGSGSNITVTKDEQFCYITVAGEEPIAIPLTVAAVKIQLVFDESAIAYMSAGETVKIPYTIVAPEGVKTSLETFETPGWIVEIEDGSFSITAPDKVAGGKILFALTSEDGGSFVKIVRILDGEGIATSYSSDATGGTLSLPGVTSITIPESVTWITQSTGESGPVLNVAANTGEDRSAEITIVTAAGVTRTIVINQLAAAAIIIAAPDEVAWKGGVLELPVRANVEFTASVTVGSDWLTGLKTKAMTETVYTVNVAQNISVARQGEITVTSSDGTIVQKVAIPQESRFWIDTTIDGPANPRNTTPVFNKACTYAYFVTRGARRVYQVDLVNRKMGWVFDMNTDTKNDNGYSICVNPKNGDVFAANQKKVFCIKEEDGQARWSIDAPGSACSTVQGNGFTFSNDCSVVFFGTQEGKFYAVNADTGEKLANLALEQLNHIVYAVYGDNNVFIAQEGKYLLFEHFTGSAFQELGKMGIGVGFTDMATPLISKDQSTCTFVRGDGYVSSFNLPEMKDHLDYRPMGNNNLAMSPFYTLDGRIAIPYQTGNNIHIWNPAGKIYDAPNWVSYNCGVSGNSVFNYMGLSTGTDGKIYYYAAGGANAFFRMNPSDGAVEKIGQLDSGIPEYQAVFNFGGPYMIIGGGKSSADEKSRIVVLKMDDVTRAKGWYGVGGDPCKSSNANLVWGN